MTRFHFNHPSKIPIQFRRLKLKGNLTKMTSSTQDSDASLNFSSSATLNFGTPTAEDRELEMLIIASIQTLKRGNKKCGKDEVFRLFRYSVDGVTKETFDKLSELLIQNQSVRLNVVGNRECLPLPKKKQKLRGNDENREKLVLKPTRRANIVFKGTT